MEWYFFCMTAAFMVAPKRMGYLVGLVAVGYLTAVASGRAKIALAAVPRRKATREDLP